MQAVKVSYTMSSTDTEDPSRFAADENYSYHWAKDSGAWRKPLTGGRYEPSLEIFRREGHGLYDPMSAKFVNLADMGPNIYELDSNSLILKPHLVRICSACVQLKCVCACR